MNVLMVSPHPDDFLLYAGATLIKHKKAGDNIYLLIASECEHLARNRDITGETDRVIAAVNPGGHIRLSLPNMILWNEENRAKIRRALEAAPRPDLVYCPWRNDTHQDHKAVAEEVFRVFKHTCVLEWYHPHSCPGFAANYYVVFGTDEAWKKIELMHHFKSQYGCYYWGDRFNHILMVAAGQEINRPYAEKFMVRRWIA